MKRIITGKTTEQFTKWKWWGGSFTVKNDAAGSLEEARQIISQASSLFNPFPVVSLYICWLRVTKMLDQLSSVFSIYASPLPPLHHLQCPVLLFLQYFSPLLPLANFKLAFALSSSSLPKLKPLTKTDLCLEVATWGVKRAETLHSKGWPTCDYQFALYVFSWNINRSTFPLKQWLQD